MKKILTLLAIGIVGLTSCKKEEPEIISVWFEEYELLYSSYKDFDDPYPPISAGQDLYRECGIECIFSGYNLRTYGFDAAWSVSCDADWCHYEYEIMGNPYVDYTYSGSDVRIRCPLKLRVTVDENATGETRYANIDLTCNGNPFTVTITQLGAPSVTVSTPGTLTQELGNKDLLYATSLKISGELNDKDLETIKGLREVETLDLTEAIIDDLPDEMFCMNQTIKHVKLPETIKVIHPRTFAFSSLEYIYFPAGVETIEDGERDTNEYSWKYFGAFANTNLAAIEFAPNSKLKYIGECAFAGAGEEYYRSYNDTYSYTLDLTLPASLETVANYAFSHNSRGSYPNYESRKPTVKIGFEEGSKLKSFGGTFLLNSISIDAGNCTMVDYIGNLYAEYVSVAIGTQIPPASGGVASSTSSYLYVPKGCVGAYYEADGWKQFDIIKEIE